MFLNLCMQHLGPENVFSGLLMTSQRRIQQQISRCADSISKHQSRRSLLNAQQHELCVGRWEECRWQPFLLSETALPKAYTQVQGSEKTCFGNCKPIHTQVHNAAITYLHEKLGPYLVLKILMPFDLKSSSKPVAEQRMLYRWEVLDRFMVQSLVSNLILEILHFFSCVFQIFYCIFIYLQIQICYLQRNYCLKIENTISRHLLIVIFKYLLPPTNPVTLSFATIYVLLSVEDSIRRNLTAFCSNFILLNLSKTKKERRDLNVPLQSSLKLELSSSTLLLCAQQRKVLVPLVNQR